MRAIVPLLSANLQRALPVTSHSTSVARRTTAAFKKHYGLKQRHRDDDRGMGVPSEKMATTATMDSAHVERTWIKRNVLMPSH
ncbi:protein of unknown function [Hyphomicrobium sp. 1Nfss2.1]